MSKRETWKSLCETVPAADKSMQKTLGIAAQGWRLANALYRGARSLQWDAKSRARIHTAAAADAGKAMVDPLRKASKDPYVVQHVMAEHRDMANDDLAIADAHGAVAERAHAAAAHYASMLINKLTPELVLQRLSALEPAMAATIKRRFGEDLADARTRARVFEACDFAQWEGAVDKIALTKHESIPTTPGYV